MAKLARKDWPGFIPSNKLIKGFFTGGCVARGAGSSFRAKAHAHARPTDPNFGWICVRAEHRIQDRDLMLHEVAHILTQEGHTVTWRDCLLRIGGTLDATGSLKSYHARSDPDLDDDPPTRPGIEDNSSVDDPRYDNF
jgi:hypothetical protein